MLTQIFAAALAHARFILDAGPTGHFLDWIFFTAALIGYLVWAVKIGIFLGRSLEYVIFTKFYRGKLPFVADMQAEHLKRARKEIVPKWRWENVKKAMKENRWELAGVAGMFLVALVGDSVYWGFCLPGVVLLAWWAGSF